MGLKTSRIGPSRRVTLAGGSALAAGALAYIAVNDPHRAGSPFPPCPFRALTGWYCPGCGGLRMTYDLLHIDFAAAAADNLMLLVGLPLAMAWWLLRRRQRRPPLTPVAITVAAVTLIAWTVLRNLPGFPLVPTVAGT